MVAKQSLLAHVDYRRNLGLVGRVQSMDKAQESIVVAALARFFSHFLVCFTYTRGVEIAKFDTCPETSK